MNTRLFHQYAEYSSLGKADFTLPDTEHTSLNTGPANHGTERPQHLYSTMSPILLTPDTPQVS